jgi:hypothetical protein
MPTFISQRTGRAVSDAEVRAMLDRRSEPSAPSGRQAFTDRLGLPATATDAEFFAALDAQLAQRRPAAAPSPSAEEQLYARFTGRASAPPAPISMSDDAVMDRFYGKPAV